MELVRAKVAARFATVLLDDTMGRHLEVCLWNWTIRKCMADNTPRFWEHPKFRYRYTTRALGLEFNLRHPKNPGLGDRVRSKALGLKAFANMTPYQMFPELWEPVFQQVAARQLRREAPLNAHTAPDTGLFQCGKCKSRKTAFVQLQTRSADEPMTVSPRTHNAHVAKPFENLDYVRFSRRAT